jgi:DNA-binding transcriptional LysR family regulator
MPALLAPSVAEYADFYPDVTVHLTATSRLIDVVEQGYDLAIWYAAVPDSNLIIRRLASYRMVICASPKYLAKYGRPEHPSDLIKHNSVIFYDATVGKEGKEWLFTGSDGDFSVRLSGTLENQQSHAFRAAALHGQGLIIAPSPMLFDDLNEGALVPVLSDFLGRLQRIEDNDADFVIPKDMLAELRDDNKQLVMRMRNTRSMRRARRRCHCESA